MIWVVFALCVSSGTGATPAGARTTRSCRILLRMTGTPVGSSASTWTCTQPWAVLCGALPLGSRLRSRTVAALSSGIHWRVHHGGVTPLNLSQRSSLLTVPAGAGCKPLAPLGASERAPTPRCHRAAPWPAMLLTYAYAGSGPRFWASSMASGVRPSAWCTWRQQKATRRLNGPST